MISFIIPYRSDGTKERERSFRFVYGELALYFPDAEIIVADNDGPFSRAAARNEGAKSATGELLGFVDADSWVRPQQLDALISHERFVSIKSGPMFPYSRYYALSELGTEEFFKGAMRPWEVEYVFPGPDPIDRPPAVGGVIAVRREDFDLVNGYDERFRGWGEEDRAFAFALETLVGPLMRVEGDLYHLWHPAPESERFDGPHFAANRALGDRYRVAAGDRDAMRSIIDSRP